MENITIPLVNETKLDNLNYTIYVLGFSSASKKFLSQQDETDTASFVEMTSEKGTIPAYKLGTDIAKIAIDTSPIEKGSTVPKNRIDGARIYFFISENSKFSEAPKITYSNHGASVKNVKNPPNTDVAPYTFVEFTLVDLGYGAVIDSQTVDGFVFPLKIKLNDDLGQIGQPLTINRESILNAYKPFMASVGNNGSTFNNLQYAENSGGLLNPGAYLNEMSNTGEFSNLDSPLNTLFDTDLRKFFLNNNLSIKGVRYGAISEDVYTAVSGKQKLPDSQFSHQALQFKGKTNGEIFNIFSPVGLCVLSCSRGGRNTPIIGTIKKTTLTFKNPLPAETLILEGMYVQGAGVSGNATVKKIITNDSNEITAVDFGIDLQQPAPNSQYRFSKVNNMFLTSGTMVFGNQGVFAYSDGVSGDGKAVILNLQNQIVSAFNRGVANISPSSGADGYSSKYWGTETNWYPKDTVQNLFSLFMHTGTTADETPIFLQAKDSVECARKTKMGQSYGFAYDENPGPVPPAPTNQPEVPSKYDPLPKGTNTITITLGPWTA